MDKENEERDPEKLHWFTNDQEFSPPHIAYVPETFKKTVYAICNIENSDSSITGTVKMSQESGKHVKATVNVEA